MRIAHLSMTAIAGACWSWSEAFKEAGYDSICICPRGYYDGRSMPSDHDWPPDNKGMPDLLSADVIFCYQGHPYRQNWYPRDKPTVGIYVSQPQRHVWRGLEGDGWPWGVIGEYQTRLYPGCLPVPNLIPLEHPWFRPDAKPREYVKIVYSPSNQHMSGWDDKAYEETRVCLLNVAQDTDGHKPVEIDIITNRSLEECLRRKASAHIAIDECVTGAYHGNSLQGLALGCVVVNNADEQSCDNVREMTGGADPPFVKSDMDNLGNTLRSLIAQGTEELAEQGRCNRIWMDRHWSPAELIDRNFRPLIEAATKHAQHD